jgi:hypothetical protein
MQLWKQCGKWLSRHPKIVRTRTATLEVSRLGMTGRNVCFTKRESKLAFFCLFSFDVQTTKYGESQLFKVQQDIMVLPTQFLNGKT